MTTARRSPPTQRVVAVLDHFVTHGGARSGLSELARATGLAKPTCLGILTSLAEAGYLVRDQKDKTYGLGPALIAAGALARRNFAAADVAARHLSALSDRYQAACTASAVVGGEVMVLASTSPAGAPGRSGPASATRSPRRSG